MDKLDRIINHLILYSRYLTDNGLFHGKMGISILFYKIHRVLKQDRYEEFAGDLLDDVVSGLSKDLPVSLEYGFSGLGYGIAYLLHNRFIEGDPEDIFSEIDNKIMEQDLLHTKDLSLKKGLTGILTYAEIRMSLAFMNKQPIPFTTSYYESLLSVAEKNPGLFNFTHYRSAYNLYPLLEEIYCKDFSSGETIDNELPLGLNKGYAGYLYNELKNLL